MKLCVLTVPFSQQPLSQVLPYLRTLGIDSVELGTGGFTDRSHCDPEILLRSPENLRELKLLLSDNGMSISVLSCHGNPVHPQKDIAYRDHKSFEDTLNLANALEVDTVVTFSGCPGGTREDISPNWITCPWPDDFARALDYQWNDVLIPYWQYAGAMAERAGVRVAIEPHPGFCVFNPESMLRLREAVGKSIGVNFDPSHLFWQGIDPVAAIRELSGCIYHVHAKDCRIDILNCGKNGVLETKNYGQLRERSWIFRTVGFGHGEALWRDIISELRLSGYDGAISIEHEDVLMSITEGVEKAAAFLRPLIISDPNSEMWWS